MPGERDWSELFWLTDGATKPCALGHVASAFIGALRPRHPSLGADWSVLIDQKFRSPGPNSQQSREVDSPAERGTVDRRQ